MSNIRKEQEEYNCDYYNNKVTKPKNNCPKSLTVNEEKLEDETVINNNFRGDLLNSAIIGILPGIIVWGCILKFSTQLNPGTFYTTARLNFIARIIPVVLIINIIYHIDTFHKKYKGHKTRIALARSIFLTCSTTISIAFTDIIIVIILAFIILYKVTVCIIKLLYIFISAKNDEIVDNTINKIIDEITQ